MRIPAATSAVAVKGQTTKDDFVQSFAPPDVFTFPSLSTQLRTATPPGSALAGIWDWVTRWSPLLGLLVPMTTDPKHDELDPEDQVWNPPPPPTSTPPGDTDPVMPPNWNDMLEWPGTPRYVPLTPIPLEPVELPEFIVSPPAISPRPMVPLPSDIEVPRYVPDFGIGARPGPAPAPTSTPRIDPAPRPADPDLEPFAPPDIAPLPRPASPSAPDLFGAPLPDIIRDPIADPFTPPALPTPTRPDTRTPTVTPEDPILTFLQPLPTPSTPLQPVLTEFSPQPLKPVSNTCSCAPKKKPKKKKSKDRDICYRGTYVQRKKGISYKKIEEVPCEAKSKSKPSTRSSPSLSLPGSSGSLLGLLPTSRDPSLIDVVDRTLKKGDIFDLMQDLFLPKKKAAPKKKRNRRGKTRLPTLPGSPYSTPFPQLGD